MALIHFAAFISEIKLLTWTILCNETNSEHEQFVLVWVLCTSFHSHFHFHLESGTIWRCECYSNEILKWKSKCEKCRAMHSTQLLSTLLQFDEVHFNLFYVLWCSRFSLSLFSIVASNGNPQLKWNCGKRRRERELQFCFRFRLIKLQMLAQFFGLECTAAIRFQSINEHSKQI